MRMRVYVLLYLGQTIGDTTRELIRVCGWENLGLVVEFGEFC